MFEQIQTNQICWNINWTYTWSQNSQGVLFLQNGAAIKQAAGMFEATPTQTTQNSTAANVCEVRA